MPPLVSQTPRSPKTPHHSQHRFAAPTSGYFGLVVNNGDTSVRSAGSTRANNHITPSGSEAPATYRGQKTPLDARPDLETFKAQAERSMSGMDSDRFLKSCGPSSTSMVPSRAQSSRTPSQQKNNASPQTPTLSLPEKQKEAQKEVHEEPTPGRDSSHPSRSPKRLLSQDSSNFFAQPRRQSPAAMLGSQSARSLGSPPLRHEEKHPRLSLSHSVTKPTDPSHNRAVTLPSSLEPAGPSMATSQHVYNVLACSGDDVLLLDLRVSTQYAKARISGAMNLCIPTTLLKRPSYNVQRLSDTLKDDSQKVKLENWRGCKSIVVYDTSSSQLKEATNCLNVLKKFTSEGWTGESCIIRGGFVDFAQKFPKLIDRQSSSDDPGSSNPETESDMADVPPVIGGCPMPATKNAANPFFGNIRQNMDLIGGVGQLPVNCPQSISTRTRHDLPLWLRQATDERDHGKTVSNKFLQIEKREQKRMQEALSGNVVYNTPNRIPDSRNKVQIAGIEKGVKNRYNNIWPFEHSRVKLKGVPKGGCDYVNANFLGTSMSKRSYIATQGPTPATFSDFWNMVWQRDIRLVVMLTAESEGGQVKAHNYWSGMHYGPVKINHHGEQRVSLEPSKLHRQHKREDPPRRSLSHHDRPPSIHSTTSPTSSDRPFVTVRKLTISHDEHPFERMREVTQLQYSNWPDFGAPAHPAHLLGLVEHSDSVRRSLPAHDKRDEPTEDRPVLVHCSAGCGRTGTFCTIETVLDILQQQQRRRKTRERDQRQTSPMDLDSDRGEGSADANPFFGPNVPTSPRDGHRKHLGVEYDRGGRPEADWVARDDVDLVEKTVEELRLQRLSMVQTLRQFVLCYETVLEWIGQQGAESRVGSPG